MSNDYKNLSGAVEECIFLKMDVNTDTYYKHASYSSSNSKGKHD